MVQHRNQFETCARDVFASYESATVRLGYREQIFAKEHFWMGGICFANMGIFSVHIILGGADGEDWHVPILRLLAVVCIKHFQNIFD